MTYIVYHPRTFVIHSQHDYWGKKIKKILSKHPNTLTWLNTTHPTAPATLDRINYVNNTTL